MKKELIRRYGRLLCAFFMLLFPLFACTGNDDSGNEEEDPITATANYSFSMNKSYLSLVDVSITYWNDKGELQTEVLASGVWTKSFEIKQTQQIGYTVTATMKSDIDELLTADSYNLGYDYADSYLSSDGKGNHNGTSMSSIVPKDNVKAYLTEHAEIHKFSQKWDNDAKTFESK